MSKKPVAPSIKWERTRSWAPLVISFAALLGIVGGLIGLGSYLEIIKQHDTTIKEYGQKFKVLENAQAIFDLDKRFTKELYDQDKRIFAIELTMKLNSNQAPLSVTTTAPRPTAGKQR